MAPRIQAAGTPRRESTKPSATDVGATISHLSHVCTRAMILKQQIFLYLSFRSYGCVIISQ